MGSKVIETFQRHVIANYGREQVVFVRGEGSELWDENGKRYIDLFPGWGTCGLGHCPPAVVAAVRDQVGQLIHMPNNFYTPPQGALARVLAEESFGGQSFFCNSGAEAVEAAIKLARLGTPEGRFRIITMRGSFHGRTLGAITATAQEAYQKGFGPMPAGFDYAQLNDIESVKKLVGPESCAILLEPVQGEGGVRPADQGFLSDLRRICDDQGMVLIFDEVQTGMGRTGTFFGYQGYGVTPDIMVLAKALGGGMPIGAIVAKPQLARYLVPGMHASTFGGNPVACRAALAVAETLKKEKLCERAKVLGDKIQEHFLQLAARCSLIKEVRGRGLMIGVELDREGKAIFDECLKRGLLINCTQKKVLRLLPALNVPDEVLEEGLGIMDAVLTEAAG